MHVDYKLYHICACFIDKDTYYGILYKERFDNPLWVRLAKMYGHYVDILSQKWLDAPVLLFVCYVRLPRVCHKRHILY